jgi:hypothetical protein
MTTSEAVIYLAEARTCIQDGQYRSYQALKQPFFDLITFNDETLAAGAAVQHETPALIIPLVGDLVVDNFKITNPYKEELVNYLYIEFKLKTPGVIADLDLKQNSLNEIIPGHHYYIGKYDGRRDDIYKLSGEAAGVFVFVISGAFEVANRLLQSRDGLALWNIKEFDFEALSSDAIVLILEVTA